MTRRYEISSSETTMGVYEGETEQDAIRACWRDAGYRTDADVVGALGGTVESLMAELTVREVQDLTDPRD